MVDYAPPWADDLGTIGAYSTPDYLALPHPTDTWILEHLLPLGGALSLYGPPKRGKSYLALQLAAAVCEDTLTWLDYPVGQRGRVLYCQTDVPRVTWQTQHLQVLKAAHCPMIQVYHADRECLPWPFDIQENESYDALAEIVRRLTPVVVIYDTMREMHHADENDSRAMKLVVQRFMAVAQGAATVFVGHSKKPTETGLGSAVHGLRGSSYLTGRMDTIIQCRSDRLLQTGRSIEDQIVYTTRTPHLWQRCPGNGPAGSLRAAARQLADTAHIPFETARSRVKTARRKVGESKQ